MDFIRTMPVPFYVAFGEDYMDKNIWTGNERQGEALKDYGYLQSTCPACVREYQARIAKLMDKLDYEGSQIYDEYPDKFSLMSLTKTITKILKETDSEEAEHLPKEEDMMQVLVCNEIYRRRLAAKKKGNYGIWTGYSAITE